MAGNDARKSDGDHEVVDQYKRTTKRLLWCQYVIFFLHILIAVLLWAMAVIKPEERDHSAARIFLAIISIIPVGFAGRRLADMRAVDQRIITCGDLPAYDWHDNGFFSASYTIFSATMAMWPAMFLFIFHQEGRDIIELIKDSGKNDLLFVGILVEIVAFVSIVVVYICALREIRSMLERCAEADESDADQEGIELNAADKRIMLISWLCNAAFTGSLIILCADTENSALYTGAVAQALILLAITYKVSTILKKNKITEQTILDFRAALMFHLWINIIIFWTCMGIALLLSVVMKGGFFDALDDLNTGNQLLVWLDMIAFGALLVLYVLVLRLHTSGMFNADEIDNAKLLKEMATMNNGNALRPSELENPVVVNTAASPAAQV